MREEMNKCGVTNRAGRVVGMYCLYKGDVHLDTTVDLKTYHCPECSVEYDHVDEKISVCNCPNHRQELEGVDQL